MRSPVAVGAFVAIAVLLASGRRASANARADLCNAPTMKTDKWRPIVEAGGMNVLLPPGFAARGAQVVADRGASQLGFAPSQATTNTRDNSSADAHFYYSGQRKIIGMGSGAGPDMFTTSDGRMNQMGDCMTVINGRRVEMSMFNWSTEDSAMAPSGDAGSHYRAVARFFPSGGLREVYISFQSNTQSDVMAYRQIFWTANFGGANPTSSPSSDAGSQEPKAVPRLASAAAPAPAAPVCVSKPDPSLPAASAVVDSALVQMLISGSGTMPKGFAVMALKFDGASLSGIAVSQSDLSDAAQKQIATLVASNLKPHDAKSPSAFMLRVESQDAGLHYSVQASCAQ